MVLLEDIDKLNDIGVSRNRNEDSYIIIKCKLDDEVITIAVVCDGMGGLDAGDWASQEICETIKFYLKGQDFENIEDINRAVTLAIKEGNRKIFKNKTQYGERCGTTVSAIVLTESKGYAWHVGDSRIIKVQNGDVRLLSEDHTKVNRMVKRGKITKEEAKRHPERNVLTKAIGVFNDVAIDRFEFSYKGSMLVLCTDGFWSGIRRKEYQELEKKNINLQQLCNTVISRGETDNITALALYV